MCVMIMVCGACVMIMVCVVHVHDDYGVWCMCVMIMVCVVHV